MPPERCDVLVIGGGIHGVGVAQAAAAHGYHVVLLEQDALASGTSSRSSKLVHGGLRYLEHGQFGLVRECLHERSLLLQLAPELVTLRPFFLPVYAQTRRRPWKLRLGLTLYALFAGFRPGSRFRSVPRAEWGGLEGLRVEGLQCVFQYWDAQTDDAALTRAVMASAQTLGATLILPAEFLAAGLEDQGCQVRYRSHGAMAECRARVVVNAAGPWVNEVLGRVTPAVPALPIELVQGTHIVVDVPLEHGVYYLEAPQDGRAVFVMPWRGAALVGTTELRYTGPPGGAAPQPEEIDYLLAVLRHYFPSWGRLDATRVQEAFSGLRVLPAQEGRPFERPRDTFLYTDRPERPRLVSIYGGKLTAYRATAEKVLARIAPSLPERAAIADTRRLRLLSPG